MNFHVNVNAQFEHRILFASAPRFDSQTPKIARMIVCVCVAPSIWANVNALQYSGSMVLFLWFFYLFFFSFAINLPMCNNLFLCTDLLRLISIRYTSVV